MAVTISIVSYANTIPLLYGLEHSGIFQPGELIIERDTPAICAQKLRDNKVSIGLVPVAVLAENNTYSVIGNHCIGAESRVETVCLFSQVPLKEIRNVYLDYQSKTSNLLLKILARHHWGIKPAWLRSMSGYEQEIKNSTAGVMIGDRCFAHRNKYSYKWDLAEEWRHFTGLPMVFACWLSNQKIDPGFIERFDKAQQYGIENIGAAIKSTHNILVDAATIEAYLTNNISYKLDVNKRKAMDEFLRYAALQGNIY